MCLHVRYKQKSTPPQDKPQAIERTTKCCSFLNREKCERPHRKEKEKNRHAKKKKPIGEKKKLFFFHLSLTLQLPIIPVSGISPQPPMSHKMQCSPTTSIAREKKKKRNYIYVCIYVYTYIQPLFFFLSILRYCSFYSYIGLTVLKIPKLFFPSCMLTCCCCCRSAIACAAG